MNERSIGLLPERYCRECGEKIINPGAHWERCRGPVKPVERTCECPAGWRHEPSCPEVTGYPDDAA